MKESFFEATEARKIAQLAREYKAKGYEVFAELHGYEPPNQIRGFRPDLIAKRGDETIIIEVKTSESIKEAKDALTEFSRYAREVPGLRFELVVTNPRPESSVHSKIQTLEAELGILRRSLLTEIKEAAKQDRGDLVLRIAVRVLEGLLTRLAMRESVHVSPEEWSLPCLAQRLAIEGVISEPVLKFANDLYRKRNTVIHAKDKEIVTTREGLDIYRKLKTLSQKWGGGIEMIEVICPVCRKAFNSYLNLARHMVLKDRPLGEHIQYLERLLNKPFAEFGWKSDAKIAAALRQDDRRQLAMMGGFSCPACGKRARSRSALLLHFRKALEGWDPVWDKTMPHSRWAVARGLKVQEGGYFADGEALKRVLYEHLDRPQE